MLELLACDGGVRHERVTLALGSVFFGERGKYVEATLGSPLDSALLERIDESVARGDTGILSERVQGSV